jgi:hypothetical protein
MSRHRIWLKLPIFGEAEAEGLIGIAALVIVVLVALAALHWPGLTGGRPTAARGASAVPGRAGGVGGEEVGHVDSVAVTSGTKDW